MTTTGARALGLIFAILLLFDAAPAAAGEHSWEVNELFSNADGTVQFIELWEADGTPNEVNVQGNTISSNANSFVNSVGPLVAPTTNKFFLIATQAFADLPGAPAPDVIIPAGSVPFFASTGDTVSYEPWDSLTFVAGELPTDGLTSLNSDLSTGLNSPTNYAGVTGSVNAVVVPALPHWGPLLAASLLLLVGLASAGRSRLTGA